MFCPSYLRKEKFVSIQLYPNRILSVQLNSLQYSAVQKIYVLLSSVQISSLQSSADSAQFDTDQSRFTWD